VVVDNLDVVSVAPAPAEANAELVVDPDAVLAEAITGQFLESVSRRHPEICEGGGGIEHDELAQSNALEIGRKSANFLALEEPFGEFGSASSGTTFVRLPGGPIISKVRDRAAEEGSGSTAEHLPTAGIIEGAARELGQGFEIERRVSGATQGRAGKVPKLAADSRAAVSWQDVDNVDLDAARNVLPTWWTTADEPHHLVRDRGDHVESICSLQ